MHSIVYIGKDCKSVFLFILVPVHRGLDLVDLSCACQQGSNPLFMLGRLPKSTHLDLKPSFFTLAHLGPDHRVQHFSTAGLWEALLLCILKDHFAFSRNLFVMHPMCNGLWWKIFSSETSVDITTWCKWIKVSPGFWICKKLNSDVSTILKMLSGTLFLGQPLQRNTVLG